MTEFQQRFEGKISKLSKYGIEQNFLLPGIPVQKEIIKEEKKKVQKTSKKIPKKKKEDTIKNLKRFKQDLAIQIPEKQTFLKNGQFQNAQKSKLLKNNQSESSSPLIYSDKNQYSRKFINYGTDQKQKQQFHLFYSPTIAPEKIRSENLEMQKNYFNIRSGIQTTKNNLIQSWLRADEKNNFFSYFFQNQAKEKPKITQSTILSQDYSKKALTDRYSNCEIRKSQDENQQQNNNAIKKMIVGNMSCKASYNNNGNLYQSTFSQQANNILNLNYDTTNHSYKL